MRSVCLSFSAIAAVLAATAQPVTFEVASVKASPERVPGVPTRVGVTGGPGSKDPGRWSCENLTLSNLVEEAYDLRAFQLLAPDWMQQARFHIEAKLPAGATKEQFREMLRNLLAERFDLKVHPDKKEMSGYELVLAKSGPKFKDAAPPKPEDADDSAPRRREPGPPPRDERGFPVLPPGMPGMAIMRGFARAQWLNMTTEELARNLSYQSRRPVTDATGLTGKYDFSLYWMAGALDAGPRPEGEPAAAPSDPAGPSLFSALQEQLGLRLESKKVTLDVIVVDHAQKTPREN
jgi:uncharacterized protein (TIGR03435 family)